MSKLNQSQLDALFSKIGDLSDVLGPDPAAMTDGAALAEARAISANTADKEYRQLVANRNCSSHSKLSNLHDCPRKYELESYKSSTTVVQEPDNLNLDFAFGHAVGAGIQTYVSTRSLVAAQFAAFTAWRAPWDAVKIDKRGHDTGKSLAWAMVAVENVQMFIAEQLADWEVLRMPNGKPAVELSFMVDTENGWYHLGHIDTVLRHKQTNKLAVWEGKTTGQEFVDEAMYGNSYQALGYGVVVDALARQLGMPATDYEVFYVAYSSKTRQFQLLPFTKSLTQRAEWLQDLLLTHAMADKYHQLGFFPKRGDHCLNKYGRRCHWYGTCQMQTSSLFPGVELPSFDPSVDRHIDIRFTLSDLIAAQKERA